MPPKHHFSDQGFLLPKFSGMVPPLTTPFRQLAPYESLKEIKKAAGGCC